MPKENEKRSGPVPVFIVNWPTQLGGGGVMSVGWYPPSVDGTVPAKKKEEKEEEEKKPSGFMARAREAWESLKPAGGRFSEMMTAGSGEPGVTDAQRGKAALGGIGELAKLIPKIGGPIAAVVQFGAVMVGAIGTVQAWNQSLRAADMQFAEFSASMANVMARQEVRDIQYATARGEARAESAERREESVNRLREAFAPGGDALANTTNNLLAVIANILTPVAEVMSEVLKAIDEIVAFFTRSAVRDRDKVALDSNRDWVEEIAFREWDRAYGATKPNVVFGY